MLYLFVLSTNKIPLPPVLMNIILQKDKPKPKLK